MGHRKWGTSNILSHFLQTMFRYTQLLKIKFIYHFDSKLQYTVYGCTLIKIPEVHLCTSQ